ncbi:MAG: hypothetical protein CFH00_01308, partial [Alphaproteobacteria bacterium MarineAlpha1_Bin1]
MVSCPKSIAARDFETVLGNPAELTEIWVWRAVR